MKVISPQSSVNMNRTTTPTKTSTSNLFSSQQQKTSQQTLTVPKKKPVVVTSSAPTPTSTSSNSSTEKGFIGPNTELSSSPVNRSVQNQIFQHLTSPKKTPTTNSLNTNSNNNTLNSGALFVPPNVLNPSSATSNNANNQHVPASIHTFSTQPSPSHHYYTKNKKPVTNPSQAVRARSVTTPTTSSIVGVNDFPVATNDSSKTYKDNSSLSYKPTTFQPPSKEHNEESQPRASVVSPRLPKPTNETENTTSDVSRVDTADSTKKSRKKSKPKKKVYQIKNYKKGDFIGQGASGKVYLGYNLDDGKFFAIKECTFENVPEDVLETKLENLQREIDLMKGLSHENIVSYYGAEIIGSTLNIFLEFVPGGSVSSLLRRYGRLSEDVVRQYTTQILHGLKYLHDNRIVHRDIKGANILVSVDGHIKLADL